MSTGPMPASLLTGTLHPPRVLYLNPTADLYGASRCLVNLLAHRAPSSWMAEAVLPAHGPLETHLQALGVPTHVVSDLAVVRKGLLGPRGLTALASTLLPSARAVARIARAMDADIIHTNSTVVLSGALASRLARTAHVWHVREITATSSRLWRWYGPLMLRASRQVVCVSLSAAEQFAAFPHHERAQVVYDGLDLDRVSYLPGREHARQSFGLPTDALVIGTMGYLNPRKGADRLIEALALVKAAYAGKVVALIAGEPYPGHAAYVERIRARAQTLGLTRDIQFTGFVRDVARFFAALDLFALPTHEPEGFGGTLLEAAAAGLPAIATRLGGAREVIDDGVTGLLIAPGSPAILAEAVLALGRDPARRQAMGAAAQRRAATSFSLKQTVTQTQQLYEALIEQAHGGAALAEVAQPHRVRSLPQAGGPGA